MKVVVTGAAGFIGSNLIRYIQRQNPEWEITPFDDLSTGSRANLDGTGLDLIVGDVADASAVARAVHGADSIVHLGALGSVPRSVADPIASHVANLNGTLNVLEAARATGAQVIFASSSSVYGANTKLPKEELDWTRPLSPYAVTKLGAEAYVLAYQVSYGLPTLALRFFNVYGPRQSAGHVYAAVVPRFVEAALTGQSLKVHGDGLQSRDFTYVDTVSAVIYSAVARRITDPHPVNLAYGTNTPINDLIELIRNISGKELSVEHVEPRLGDVRASQADGVRVGALFPEVLPVALEVGLRTTFEWYRDVLRG